MLHSLKLAATHRALVLGAVGEVGRGGELGPDDHGEAADQGTANAQVAARRVVQGQGVVDDVRTGQAERLHSGHRGEQVPGERRILKLHNNAPPPKKNIF